MSSSDAMLGRFGTTDDDVKPEMNLKKAMTHVVTSFFLCGHSRALVISDCVPKSIACCGSEYVVSSPGRARSFHTKTVLRRRKVSLILRR